MIWWAALLPALAGLTLWAWGGARPWLGILAAVVLAVTAALAALAEGGSAFAWAPDLTLRAELTPLSRAVAVTVPVVALAVVLFASGHEAADGLARLIGLLMVFTGAMQLVVIAGDLVTLLIGWELMGGCSWALIGHRWREPEPMRSANYAFVVTRAGDLGLFLAVFACFAGAGSVDYAALGRLDGAPLVLAALGLLVAAAAKGGQVPFSPWLFRAMDGPTSVSSLLHSSTMVAAGAYIVARLYPWLSGAPGFAAATLGVGLATAVAGGVVAATHMHAKKLLAGSTSAQIGLMFAATGAGYPGIGVFHLVTHAFFKAPLFFAAGVAHEQTGSFDLRQMWLGRAMPAAAVLTAVSVLSLAGVPPLGAAWTKEETVKALQTASPWIALVGIIAGGLSAAYAIRFGVMAYGPGERTEASGSSGLAARLSTAARVLLTVITLALSTLWLPGVHDAVAGILAIALPHGGPLLLVLSLGAVSLGALAGLWLARHPVERRWADWLGLPWLIDRAVERPGLGLARLAARVDDALFDGLPRGAAAIGRRGSAALGLADDRGIDGVNEGAAGPGRGGIAALVRLATAAARGTSRAGEAATDLLAGGTGRLAGMAGADARRVQTGMSHHYYVLLAGGAAAGILLLILGA